MRTFQTLGVASIALCANLLAVSRANALDICDLVKRCDNGCYASLSRFEDVQSAPNLPAGDLCAATLESAAEESGYMTLKQPLNVAPVPVVTDCVGYGNGLICEAWPKGESITYAWTASSGITVDSGAPANDIRGFSCSHHGTAGTITLTALSPQGAGSSISTAVSCP